MNPEVGRASCELAGLRLDADGAQLFGGAVRDHVAALLGAIAPLSIGAARIRIHRVVALDAHITSTGVIGAVAASLLGPASRPVRAILFDKSAAANWALGWHQDRTIAVAARADVPCFTRWTIKGGLLHVSPPATILEAMITLRVHLDDVPADNAPLLIAPGSHRLGLVREGEIEAAVETLGMVDCLATAGDIWAYSSPILPASRAACGNRRRRVLQVDYAAFDLPGGLRWLGV